MPSALDRSIGERISARRILLGMSQAELASRIGARKYEIENGEAGVTCVRAAQLNKMAVVLDVPLLYFFADTVRTGERRVSLLLRFMN